MEIQVAIVTGAARGIGREIANRFAKSGWLVHSFDIIMPNEVTEKFDWSANIVDHKVNCCDSQALRSAFQDVMNSHSRIDLLVNNAGIGFRSGLEDFPEDEWQRVIDINITAVFLCMKIIGGKMLEKGKGSIVNITSISAERGAPGRAAYVASKAAVIGLTRTAAVEWGGRGIRVNAVGPGYVETPMLLDALSSGELDSARILQRIPQGRFAKPEEIAAAVYFLASDEASYINGQTLFVDGAFLADYGVNLES
jgi:3-oxoacyl-[acyl-carrier protein] reductase